MADSPTPPFLAAFAGELRALRSTTKRSQYHVQRVPVTMQIDEGRLTFRTQQGSSLVLRVIVEPPGIALEEEHVVGWEWNRDVLGCALDHLIAALELPGSREAAALAAWATQPSWVRALRTFDRIARPVEPPPAQVLSISVTLDAGFSVEPRAHKVQRNGKLSAGRLIRPDERCEFPDKVDMRAFEALWRFADGGRINDLLDALVAHPRVSLTGQGPIRPVRVTPALSVATLDEGFALALAVGTQTLAPRAVARLLRDGEIVVGGANGELFFGEVPDALARLLSAFAVEAGPVPAAGVTALLERLARLGVAVDVRLPDELASRVRPAPSTPLVLLEALSQGALRFDVVVEPSPGGARMPPGDGPQDLLFESPEGPCLLRRDLAAERAAAEALAASVVGAHLDDGPFARLVEPSDAPPLLIGLASRAVRVEWRGRPGARLLGVASRSGLRLKVTDKRDWLGLDGGVEVDGETVTLAALLEAVRERRRWVQLAGDKLVEIADDLAKALDDAAGVIHAGKGGLEVSRFAVAALARTVERDAQLEGAVAFRGLLSRIERAEALDPKVPRSLRVDLRPYQRDGYRWLVRLASWEAGGVLADEMGLGKTVQALALLTSRAKEGPQLVVAPMSVAPNWLREAARFAPSLDVRLHHGQGRALSKLGPGVVLVTTYDVLTRDREELAEIDLATLVLDEAQAVKNADSLRAKAARALRARARFALTGTPIENHLGELWSLFRVLLPGLLGSWESFRVRFALPIERDKDEPRRAALAHLVRPFLLRRTKADVAPELPPRTEVNEVIALTRPERDVYDAIRIAAVESLSDQGGDGDARFRMLAAITRLRLAACHPRLVDPASTVPSSKLSLLLEIVAELREGGHKALVFSQFVQHLSLARAALEAAGVPLLYLDGQTSSRDRQARIDAFQAGQADVFLISLRAGGTGLNLTAADYVLHLDPWWNPAVEDQATDRAHRIGQDKPVTVIRLLAEETIEESVLKLHGDKRALAAALLEGTEQAGALSVAELAGLIRGA